MVSRLRAALCAACLPLLAACEGLFFYPSEVRFVEPARIGLHYEEVAIKDAGEPTLIAWFIHAEGKALGTVVHLHGNAENMSTHIRSVYWLPTAGYNVFLFDYRGFGGSEGTPSFAGLVTDAARAFRYVRALPDVAQDNLIMFGQSLGGTVGLYAAAQPEFAGMFSAIVVDSAFSGYRQIAWEKMKSTWLTMLGAPFLALIPDGYSPLPVVGSIKAGRFLFVHREIDPVVDPENTVRLYEKAPEPKEIWCRPGNGHVDLFADQDWRGRLLEYLGRAL